MPAGLVVYALVDMRETHRGSIFYVGMGVRNRPLRHAQDARSQRGHYNRAMQEIMEGHFTEGIVPDILILNECADYPEACSMEKDYITRFGRRGINAGGILVNVYSGYDDTGTNYPHVREARSAASTEANNRLWADLEHRAKRVIAMRGKRKTMSTEAIEARLKNLALARTPEARAEISAELLKRWSDPAYRAKRSRNQTAAWEDPEKRANMLEGRSEGIAQSWENPETREKRAASVQRAIAAKWESDPDYAERARAGLRAAWADPEKKAARIAKMLESRRRKAAERRAQTEAALEIVCASHPIPTERE